MTKPKLIHGTQKFMEQFRYSLLVTRSMYVTVNNVLQNSVNFVGEIFISKQILTGFFSCRNALLESYLELNFLLILDPCFIALISSTLQTRTDNFEQKKIYTYSKKSKKVKKFNEKTFRSVTFISFSVSEQ